MIPFLLTATSLLLALALRLALCHRSRGIRPAPKTRSKLTRPPVHRFHPPKPPWVRREVLRLKALMPEAGCRRIAQAFNRLHRDRRGMTVGKTFVADTLRDHGEELLRLRRQIKHPRPRRLARNIVWALDWTWMAGPEDESRPILGVLDHGSRARLELEPVESRRTVALLRRLLDLFERFGTPKVLRTDNEPAGRSLVFRLALRLFGIRHQRTEPFAPWQNGRIERLFRTVTDVIRHREERTGIATVTVADLAAVRTWYNHLRPHQHLDGRTPAEVWSRKEPDRRQRARWLSTWDGLLAGCYWPG